MTYSNLDRFIRQSGIIDNAKLRRSSVSIIGAGSVGSFTALTLAKMGVNRLSNFDDDIVSEVNIPNQFLDPNDIDLLKVDSVSLLVEQLTGVKINTHATLYKSQKLAETVIVCTDTFSSRKLVWDAFLKQKQCVNFIDSRMGAELAKLYSLKKNNKQFLSSDNRAFYEETLRDDSEAEQLPCTAKSIIYNVLMIVSLISASYKNYIQEDKFPREIIFNMTRFDKLSLMIRD